MFSPPEPCMAGFHLERLLEGAQFLLAILQTQRFPFGRLMVINAFFIVHPSS